MQVRAAALIGVTLAALAPAVPAVAAQTAGSKVTVCHFVKQPLDPATPNPRYPFGFLLSTAQQDSANRQVRKAVRSVQLVLSRIGIRDSAGRQLVVDGSYGPQTAFAVRRFQQRENLFVDGKVGKQTWKRLSKSCFVFH